MAEEFGGLDQLGTPGDLDSDKFASIGGEQPGALSSVSQPIDTEGAISRLMASRTAFPRDQIDLYTERALKLMPTEQDIAMSRQAINVGAGQRADYYANPPIDRSLPWLGFSAGMLKPTRTGSTAESIGTGLGALQEGRMAQNQQELVAGRLGAEAAYSTPRDTLNDQQGFEKLGVDAMKAQALIKRAEQLGQRGTPTMQEYAWMQGKLHANPEEEAAFSAMGPQERVEELRRRKEAWLFRQGSSTVKTASVSSGDSAVSAETARIANAPLWAKAVENARKMIDPQSFANEPIGVLEKAVNDLALTIFNGVPKTSRAAPAAAAAPAPAAAAAAPPPAPAAGPLAGDVIKPPVLPEAPAAKTPFDDYLVPPAQATTAKGTIPSAGQKAAIIAAAKQGEDRASDFLTKVVYPTVEAADGLRSSATIAKNLLQTDPQLTGAMKPFLGQMANILTTLGLAPAAAQHFASNMSIFYSQAMLNVLAQQLAQKGVQTESDALRMLQAGIDPSKPAEANRYLIRYMEAVADRSFERANFFDAWSKKNNSIMGGSVEAWNKYSREHPMAKIVEGKVHFRSVK